MKYVLGWETAHQELTQEACQAGPGRPGTCGADYREHPPQHLLMVLGLQFAADAHQHLYLPELTDGVCSEQGLSDCNKEGCNASFAAIVSSISV